MREKLNRNSIFQSHSLNFGETPIQIHLNSSFVWENIVHEYDLAIWNRVIPRDSYTDGT